MEISRQLDRLVAARAGESALADILLSTSEVSSSFGAAGIGVGQQALTGQARLNAIAANRAAAAAAAAGPARPRPLPTTFALFLTETPVEVDLLVVEPESTDPSTWFRTTSVSPNFLTIEPETLAVQGSQLQSRLTWPNLLSAADLSQIWGVGVSYEGYGLLAWPLAEGQLPGELVIDLFLALVQNP
jgi:hypothetical protein